MPSLDGYPAQMVKAVHIITLLVERGFEGRLSAFKVARPGGGETQVVKNVEVGRRQLPSLAQRLLSSSKEPPFNENHSRRKRNARVGGGLPFNLVQQILGGGGITNQMQRLRTQEFRRGLGLRLPRELLEIMKGGIPVARADTHFR